MADTVAVALPAWTGRLVLAGTNGRVGTVDLAMPAPSITLVAPDFGIAGSPGVAGAVVLAWPRPRLIADGDADVSNELVATLTWLMPAIAASGITGINGPVALTLSLRLAIQGAAGALGAISLTLPAFTLQVFSPNSAALALPALNLAAAGAPGALGRVQLALPALGLAGAGSGPRVAGIALTLTPRLTVQGLAGAGAVLALALPAPRLAVQGAAGVNGFVALALSPPRLVVAGYSPVRGSLQLAWPVPQLAVRGRETTGATFATIAMHTETLAVSTYDNYPFNAFARFNGVNLGSSSAGVFVLAGELDDGAAIAAQIQLGKLDFGTSHMKRVERFYVGYRAGGDLALSVAVDENNALTYALAANGVQSLHGARVVPAKGPAGRYWQFTISNTGGADFSLDAFEAAPSVLARRVRSA
jgi:hypothetical protein